MDCVDAALKTLDTAVARSRARGKKRLVEAAGHLSTHLVLLKLCILSSQLSEKVSHFLRDSLRILYAGVTVPALKLAAAIFESVYHERILSAIGSAQQEQKGLWESVLYALLSGVLDFLEDCGTAEVKDTIGETLFPVLCDITFSLSAPKTGVDLRCTAYNVLIDAAAAHQGNQNRLRDTKVLGGERLGSCLWRTKDYLALESLLNLFARALPSTHKSASGRARRTAFIHSVFKVTAPSDAIDTGVAIIELLEHVPTSDWEETSMRIVDVLAKGNVTYPQPFPVKEVSVYGRNYPSDRLYADDKTFLANVLFEDDQYESLEISYAAVTRIDTELDTANCLRITLSLSSPPRLGQNLIEDKDPEGGCSGAAFSISTDDHSRFLQTLDSRGLKHLVSSDLQPLPKLSLAMEPTKLELDGSGRLVPELSQTERIENVSQFYETNELSDGISSGGEAGESTAGVELSSPSVNNALDAGDHHHPDNDTGVASGLAMNCHTGPGTTSLARTISQKIRDTAFGTADEDLSEISECESPLPRSRVLRRTSTAASVIRGQISFEPTYNVKTVSNTARIVRGGIGKVILDSDDDSPAPVPQQAQLVKKKAIIREPRSEAVALCVSAPLVPLAELPGISVTPPSQQGVLSSSDTLGPQSGKNVLQFSNGDIPAPDFHAPLSSPSVVPKSALKAALVKNPPLRRRAHENALLDTSPPRAAASAPAARVGVPADTNADDRFYDFLPPPSSPTPVTKKSVKIALRKKNRPPPPTVEKPVKRKSPMLDDADVDKLLDNGVVHPRKRPRTSAAASGELDRKEAKPKVNDEEKSVKAEPFRPAMRAQRKYYARKGRASSPIDSHQQTKIVDFDALPSPPRPSTLAAALGQASSPMRKKTMKEKDANAEKVKTKVEKTTKTEPSAKAKKVAVKSETVSKLTTAGKTENVDTTGYKTRKTEKEGLKDKTTTTEKTEKVVEIGTHVRNAKADKQQRAKNTKLVDDNKSEGSAPRFRLRPRLRTVGEGAAKDKVEDAKHSTEPEATTLSTVILTAPAAMSANEPRNVDGDVLGIVVEVQSDVQDTTVTEVDDPAVFGPVETLILDDYVYQLPEPKTENPPTTIGEVTSGVQSFTKKDTKQVLKSNKAPWDSMAQEMQSETVPGSAISRAKTGSRPTPEITDLDVSAPETVIVRHVPEEVLGSRVTATGRKDTSKRTPQAKIFAKIVPTHPDKDDVRDSVDAASSPNLARSDVDAINLTRDSFDHEDVMSSKEAERPLTTQQQPETIDLTGESPSRPAKRLSRPRPPTEPLASEATDAIYDIATGRKRASQQQHSVRFAEPDIVSAECDETLINSPFNAKSPLVEVKQELLDSVAYGRGLLPKRRVDQYPLHQQSILKKGGFSTLGARPKYNVPEDSREDTPPRKSRYDGDPSMSDIVEVLEEIHNTVVRSIENKFAGVRHEARVGRDELLRHAATDLNAIRGDSIIHFNKMVGIEAEYATVGRNVINGTEDWMKVNQEICKEVAAAVEKHDRGMLSKKMPATLIPLDI